jgi:hypothetical protein
VNPALAAISVEQTDNQVHVSGDHFRLTVDGNHGGQIDDLQLFDGSKWNRLLGADDQTCPGIKISDTLFEFRLDRAKNTRIEKLESSPDRVRFETAATPCTVNGRESPWNVRLEYEIYAEGAVFITFHILLPEGSETILTRAEISFTTDNAVVQSPKYREQINRQEDFAKSFKNKGLPSARFAFGVNPKRSFTNEVQAIVEEKAAITGDGLFVGKNGNFTWFLADGSKTIRGPFEYSNRLALGLGSAAVGKPKTNAIAQRAYHWINWIDKKEVLGAAWYPSNEMIDKMAANHATMLILHEHWMSQPGNNGDPHANYRPRDEAGLERTIRHAHEKGLRVGLYCRGIERYAPATGFFEKYLQRNRDGLYVDWNGVYCIAHHENSHETNAPLNDSHFTENGTSLPAREYFLYVKKLREMVGPEGFLIGHQGFGASGILANLAMDAFLPGESKLDHDMLSNVDNATYKGMLGGGVCMPWTIDARSYTSPPGVAKMAVWGFYPHACLAFQRRGNVLYPADPNDAANASLLPYWRILSAVDAEKCEVYNSPAVNRIAANSSDPNISCLIYKQKADNEAQDNDAYLVITANLSDKPASATITLNSNVLEMHGSYVMSYVDAQTGAVGPTAAATGAFATQKLAPWQIVGVKLFRASPAKPKE